MNDEDLILSSDLDEIPNFQNFKFNNKIVLFEQNVFYYKFNLMQPNFKWIGTRACRKKDLHGFQWLRNIKNKSYPFWRIDTFFSKKRYMNVGIIKNGGWHFTSIKKPKDIFYKLSNFMHHLEFEESGLTLKDMEDMVYKKKILYDHTVAQEENKYTGNLSLEKVSNKVLPEYIQENLIKYGDWID